MEELIEKARAEAALERGSTEGKPFGNGEDPSRDIEHFGEEYPTDMLAAVASAPDLAENASDLLAAARADLGSAEANTGEDSAPPAVLREIGSVTDLLVSAGGEADAVKRGEMLRRAMEMLAGIAG